MYNFKDDIQQYVNIFVFNVVIEERQRIHGDWCILIVEIISIHLPKNTMILGKDEFDLFGNGKILINTSLGTPFQIILFLKWIQGEGNFAIYGEDGAGSCKNDFEKYLNIIFSKKVAGWTKEARKRLSIKVLENIEQFLNEHNAN